MVQMTDRRASSQPEPPPAPPPIGAPSIQTAKNSSVKRLVEKIKEQDTALEPFRRRQKEFVSQLCGPLYGKGSKGHEPLQMIYHVVSVLVPSIVVDPESMVTAEDPEYAPFADMSTANLNRTLREIMFTETMESVCIDSLIMLGITKTGICDKFSRHWDDQGNYIADPGREFCERVKFSNWIGDLTGDSPGEMDFQGDRYLLDLDRARDLFRKHAADVEKAATAELYPDEGKPEEITSGKRSLDDYLIQQAQFADIWLPHEKVLVTIAGHPDAVGQHWLNEREYKGSEFGPYDYFQLNSVPDNFMQIPLVGVISQLHDLMNSVARKIQRQAERQKDLIFVPLGKPQVAGAVRDANDGDVVGVADPNEINSVSMGGANNVNYQVVAWLHDYLNRVAHNPALIGGTGPQANTLGQDEMNRASAGGPLSYQRKRLMDSAGRVLKKLAWYEWKNPARSRNLTVTTPTGVDVQMRWRPGFREGEFEDYTYEINPYTKRSRDPDEQYMRLVRMLNEVALPLQQIGAVQGQLLQPMEIVQVAGNLLGIREARRMFKRGMPIQSAGGGQMQSASAKPRTDYADNRVTRRMPAKPQNVESEAEAMGVET